VRRRFAWDGWNERHIAEHTVSKGEAEAVVRRARPPYPRKIDRQKYLVRGQTPAGRFLQVVFVFRDPTQIEYDSLSVEDILELSDHDTSMIM